MYVIPGKPGRDQLCTTKFKHMELLHQSYTLEHARSEKRTSLFHQFLTWCQSQEKYRFGWLAAIVAGHGCIITPITVLLITLSGNNMTLWALAIAAMSMSLVTNLAALPTRITIPVFFLSILIDIVVVANCIMLIL